jgi:hypothetical protein
LVPRYINPFEQTPPAKVTETVQHDATNRWITTYEYDGVGNWIKELTRKEPGAPSDTAALSSQTTQQRLIDYYEIR